MNAAGGGIFSKNILHGCLPVRRLSFQFVFVSFLQSEQCFPTNKKFVFKCMCNIMANLTSKSYHARLFFHSFFYFVLLLFDRFVYYLTIK
jgi:hypothetical protein